MINCVENNGGEQLEWVYGFGGECVFHRKMVSFKDEGRVHGLTLTNVLFTINYVGFCLCAN